MTTTTQTAAQRLYTLPEPVQERLCALVDAIAGMNALEKYAAGVQLEQFARNLLATKVEDCEPAAEAAALTRRVVIAMADEAAPAHIKEGA
jgi:hypothetical protein